MSDAKKYVELKITNKKLEDLHSKMDDIHNISCG